MRMWGNDRKLKIIGRTTFLLSLCALAGCAGGGGGGPVTNIASGSPAVPSSSSTPAPQPAAAQTAGANLSLPTGGGYANTGWTGAVGAPAPATFGTSPLPPQFATNGGPVLVGNGNTAM